MPERLDMKYSVSPCEEIDGRPSKPPELIAVRFTGSFHAAEVCDRVATQRSTPTEPCRFDSKNSSSPLRRMLGRWSSTSVFTPGTSTPGPKLPSGLLCAHEDVGSERAAVGRSIRVKVEQRLPVVLVDEVGRRGLR